jgi:uncharacterized glyoxalase superfamily protein PhnB
MPYLYYPDARAALEFLVTAFGFSEIEAFRDDEGNVWHAQLRTGGDGVVMIGPGLAEFGTRGPSAGELVASRTFIYVDNVDEHFERAREAGAGVVTEPSDQGPNRIHIAQDCGGHQWIFATPL